MQVIIFLLLCISVYASNAEESKLMSSLDGKIINGSLDDRMTYVAEIKTVSENSQRLCVTFFVTDIHLLAPAHCIQPYETFFKNNELSNEQVACTIKVSTDRSQEDIDSIFTHPKFRMNKLFSYNIGFVSLKKRVHTEMVDLPLIRHYQKIKIKDGGELVLSGFDEEGRHCSLDLLVDLKTSSCVKKFKNSSHNRLLCAYPKDTNGDITEFDIGSPLLYDQMVIGIYVGNDKDPKKRPTFLFTYVYDRLAFILKLIAQDKRENRGRIHMNYEQEYSIMHSDVTARADMSEDLSLIIPDGSLAEGNKEEEPPRDKNLFGCIPIGNCGGRW